MEDDFVDLTEYDKKMQQVLKYMDEYHYQRWMDNDVPKYKSLSDWEKDEKKPKKSIIDYKLKPVYMFTDVYDSLDVSVEDNGFHLLTSWNTLFYYLKQHPIPRSCNIPTGSSIWPVIVDKVAKIDKSPVNTKCDWSVTKLTGYLVTDRIRSKLCTLCELPETSQLMFVMLKNDTSYNGFFVETINISTI